jgi:hypothetical protein
MDLEKQRARLLADIARFTDQLQKARTDFDKRRLEATIRGTEMMLTSVDKLIAS